MKENGKEAHGMERYGILPLRENLWAINELNKTVMYVINGRDRALLLDTGLGTVPLRRVVGELCGDKPVVVVNTHAHSDHNSGNNQFDSVLVGRFDEPFSHNQLWGEERDRTSRMFFSEFLAAGGVLPEWNPGPAPHVSVLQEGDVVELGDFSLRVLETPGHTIGSISLFEESRRWLFTGDLILTWEVWGQLETSSALRVYWQTLERLAGLERHVDVVFPAHWSERDNPLHFPACELPPEILPIYAEGTGRIVRGEDAGEPYDFWGHEMRCGRFQIGGMVFNPARIG